MMLVVQTAEDVLYVAGDKVATLMPTYPGRWRVVLADGRVGHRHGELPEGPWVRLGAGWARPEWLRREGDFWVDPADFRYAFEALGEVPEAEVEEDMVPAGLFLVELRAKKWVWRTDSGELACDLNERQLRELIPNLVQANRKTFVYLPRLRRMGLRNGRGGWLELDNGEQVLVPGSDHSSQFAGHLGLETLATQDPSVRLKLWSLREYPYDLNSGDPQLIRADLPDARAFAEQLLWQAVLDHERGQGLDFGTDAHGFHHYLIKAGARCGYSFSILECSNIRSVLVGQLGVMQLLQLGSRELHPSLRLTGRSRPQVVLLAPLEQKVKARKAAEGAGISLLVATSKFHLALECLAAELDGPIQVLDLGVEPRRLELIRRRFESLERPFYGIPVELDNLEALADVLKSLPVPAERGGMEPFRRVPLQDMAGLFFADPEEIVAWVASRPNRWRVDLTGERIQHHPGPVPAALTLPPPLPGGPNLPCPLDQILWVENREGQTVWHLDGGSEVVSPLAYQEAVGQHPGLLPISLRACVNYNRVRGTSTSKKGLIRLDCGREFPIPTGQFGRKLEKVLGLRSLLELSPDLQGLRKLELRDVPYEIVRASSARLREDFSGFRSLVANVIWQVFCGLYSYGHSFSGFFYFPLQAVLYRAGYLTRAQLRAEWRGESAKERLYADYCGIVTRMVREFRLFTYQQLGFVDEFPNKRILGDRQPQRILLVEKGDKLEEYARRLQRKTGMTLLILQGSPSLLATEYFVRALREIYTGAVEVYFYGDFDFGGWDIGPAFIRQLLFYGVECIRLERLLLASIFTPEEQALYSRPLEPKTANHAGWIARFVRESGGVQGQARGIHANWLQPYARVEKRLEELLG